MSVLEGAAKLTAMVVRLERERDEALAKLAAVPVDDIRRAMADTTAQHYSWYQPIRRWLDSLEVTG